MPNPYVNKVQKADGTVIIDISDTTAVASDVASGKYFYTAAGEKVQGTASGAAAISIVDELDSHGGTIRHINGVSLTGDTVTAATLLSGIKAHDVTGAAITGTYKPVQTKTGTFTGNGSRTVTVSCDFEPDIVYWYGDPGSSASSGTVSCIIVRDLMVANRYRNNSTSNSNNIITPITGMVPDSTSYTFRMTYADGTVTLYSLNSAARNLFTNNRTYSYKFIKWTQ